MSGVTDPEKKRKIIGAQFIHSFEKIAKEFSGIKYLAQGTLYPDVIESGSSKWSTAAVIKSHHNVGGLPDKINVKIIEPLKELFKDEVKGSWQRTWIANLTNKSPSISWPWFGSKNNGVR